MPTSTSDNIIVVKLTQRGNDTEDSTGTDAQEECLNVRHPDD